MQKFDPIVCDAVVKVATENGIVFSKALRNVVFGDSLACKMCGSPVGYKGTRQPLPTYCGHRCYSADAEYVDLKRKATMMERHGAEYCIQVPVIRKKQEATNVELYGSTSALAAPSVRKKAKATLMQNYGVDSPFKSLAIRNRSKETVIERYGVEHVMQCPEIFEKTQYALFKSCKTVRVGGKLFENIKGFEPFALKFMATTLKIRMREVAFRAADGLPNVPWLDKAGNRHVYHPDFLVGSDHLYEVKSTYTVGLVDCRRTYFYRTKRKAIACTDAGFKFTVLLVLTTSESKYQGTMMIDDFASLTRNELRTRVLAFMNEHNIPRTAGITRASEA